MITVIKGKNQQLKTVRNFNTPLTARDRSSRQKIHMQTEALNESLDQMSAIAIYRMFHVKAGYTFFASADGHSLG